MSKRQQYGVLVGVGVLSLVFLLGACGADAGSCGVANLRGHSATGGLGRFAGIWAVIWLFGILALRSHRRPT
jgi:hypothetical protein